MLNLFSKTPKERFTKENFVYVRDKYKTSISRRRLRRLCVPKGYSHPSYSLAYYALKLGIIYSPNVQNFETVDKTVYKNLIYQIEYNLRDLYSSFGYKKIKYTYSFYEDLISETTGKRDFRKNLKCFLTEEQFKDICSHPTKSYKHLENIEKDLIKDAKSDREDWKRNGVKYIEIIHDQNEYIFKLLMRGFENNSPLSHKEKSDILYLLSESNLSILYSFIIHYDEGWRTVSKDECSRIVFYTMRCGILLYDIGYLVNITKDNYFLKGAAKDLLISNFLSQKTKLRVEQIKELINAWRELEVLNRVGKKDKESKEIIKFFRHVFKGIHFYSYLNKYFPKLDEIGFKFEPQYLSETKSKSQDQINKAFSKSFIPENKLLVNFKRNPVFFINKIPEYITRVIKEKKDIDPIMYELVPALYEIPSLITTLKFEKKKDIIESLIGVYFFISSNGKFNSENYSYLGDSLKEAFEIIIDNICSSLDNKIWIMTKKSEEEEENPKQYSKYVWIPKNITMWNKFFAPNLSISIREYLSPLAFFNEETRKIRFKDCIDSITVEYFDKEGKLTPAAENAEWAVIWKHNLKMHYIVLTTDSREETIKELKRDGLTSLNKQNKEFYEVAIGQGTKFKFLSSVYHIPTNRLIDECFDLNICTQITSRRGFLSRRWKPEVFFRYLKPYVEFPWWKLRRN